ncbi:hypothetical protein BCEN4_1380026 [Burkholderia cenocepacia]|nr:hypothetical protein BCEN4_1380026 [Burkholderia cenocepacia]
MKCAQQFGKRAQPMPRRASEIDRVVGIAVGRGGERFANHRARRGCRRIERRVAQLLEHTLGHRNLHPRGDVAALEHDQLTRLERGPDFVVGERLRCDHRDAILGGRVFREVDRQVFVDEMRGRERPAPHEVVQPRRAVREERLAIRHQEVEHAVIGDAARQFADPLEQLGQRRLRAGKGLAQPLHQHAERLFAVGRADRVVDTAVHVRRVVLQVAVMREDPVPAPQLAHERMAVLEQDVPLRRLADVGDRVLGLDRVALHHFGDRRRGRCLVIDEETAGLVFEERDAPAVGMVIGEPAPGRETCEGECDVRRRGAVHSKELAHFTWGGRLKRGVTNRANPGTMRLLAYHRALSGKKRIPLAKGPVLRFAVSRPAARAFRPRRWQARSSRRLL